MDAAEQELERRSRFLNSLILQKKKQENNSSSDIGSIVSINIRVRASDMPPPLQDRAFRTATDIFYSIGPSSSKIDTTRLALSLKKDFDLTYGPAWHCIVGTSFGSYVTHSLGGFLYFSIDKVYVLLFKTTVEPLDR